MADQTVRTKEINWAELVKATLGKDWNKPPVIYQFSNGREFRQPIPYYTGTNAGQ